MLYDISKEKSVILNFFSGKVFFTFENETEVDSFFSFIKRYDSRFETDFFRKDEIKSVAWVHSNTSHKHQLEWMPDTVYFRMRDMEPISYAVVKDYVERESEWFDMLNGIKDNQNNDWWILLLAVFMLFGQGWGTYSKDTE